MPKDFADNNDEICPNCGQFTGGESSCPNCGAILDTDDDEFDGFHEEEEENLDDDF